MTDIVLVLSMVGLIFSVTAIAVGIPVVRKCRGNFSLAVVMLIFVIVIIALRETLVLFSLGYNETVAGFMRLGVTFFALVCVLILDRMVKSVRKNSSERK